MPAIGNPATPPHPSSTARRLAPRRLVVAVVAALTLTSVTTPAASAASPGIDKALDEAKQTDQNADGSFAAGADVVFTVSVGCFDDGGDASCATFELADPPPTFLDIDGNPAAMTFVGATAGATQIAVSPGPTITFVEPLSAGDSVNVDLTYRIPAWITPDATTLSNVATWGPDGGEATSPTVDVVARAKAAWTTTKSGPSQLNINEPGTYTVGICATNPDDTDFGPLRDHLRNAVLVDELPDAPAGTTLEVVNVSGGGVYDSGAGSNGTVTWNLGDLALAGTCRNETVTLRFAAAAPVPSATTVTNTVTASGTPDAAVYDFDTSASRTITVKNPDPGNPAVQKSSTRSVVDLDLSDGQSDSEFAWLIRPRNTGQGPVFAMTAADTLNEHFVTTSFQPGTWPSGPTGYDGNGNVRFTLTRASSATEVYTSDGSTNTTYTIADPVGDPIASILIEYGTVPAGWSVNNAARTRLTGHLVSPGRNGGVLDLVSNRSATIANTVVVSGDTVDAFGTVITDSASATASVLAVAPQPAPSIDKSVSIVAGPSVNGDAFPGSTLRWTVTITNPTTTATAAYPDPSIYDLVPVPSGVALGAPTNFQVNVPAGLSIDEPNPGDGVTSDTGTIGGEQLLVWDFSGDLAPGASMSVSFDTAVLDGTPPQVLTNRAWTGTDARDEDLGEWYSTFTSGSGTWEADTLDLDDDGNTSERVRRDDASIRIQDFVVAASGKTVAGPAIEIDDPVCTRLGDGEVNTDYGVGRCTRAGDRVDYRLTVTNEGNVGLDELVLIDMFPTPGDTLVLPSQIDGTVAGRGPGGVGSDFAPNLTGPVTSADPNVVVEYTTVGNPCRGADFYPQLVPTSTTWPPGCDEPSWSTSLPVPITDVRAIRVTYATVLGVDESFTFEWPMRAPVTAQIGDVAYNAFAWSASSVNSSTRNQSAPPVVAVEVNSLPKPYELGDLVWYDDDRDGIQDANETGGVEGVPVALFFDNDDSGSFTPGLDTLVANTVTDTGANAGRYLFNNLVNGRYFVMMASPTDWVTTQQDAGANEHADSDFGFYGVVGTDVSTAELDGWDPTAISSTLYDHLFVSGPVVIADDNRDDIDLGLWRPDVSIDVEKATNGNDADLTPGIHVPAGQTVVWSYDVTNTSDVVLTSLELTDTTTVGTPVPVTVVCADTELAPGASTTCLATVPSTAQVGQYGNDVEATAVPVLPAILHPESSYANLARSDGTPFFADGAPRPVTDSDPSHYFGASPSIQLVKTIQGDDADAAPGPLIPQGDQVDWVITTTNTGNVDLEITHLVDDVFGVFGDDADPTTPNGTCAGGTISFPLVLEPGDSRTCTFSAPAAYGQHTNVASVAGLPVDDLGDPIAEFDSAGAPTGTTMAPVTDTDPANYYGTVAPAISIEKTTSGIDPDGSPVGPTDADAAPGDTLLAGTDVTWIFTIANDGNVALEVTHLSDDVLGVFGDDGDADTPNRDCDGGDAEFPLVLAPGASTTCEVTGIAQVGLHTNEVSVTGTAVDGDGSPITVQESDSGTVAVDPVTDDDPSHYTGEAGALIRLDTTTSGIHWDLVSGTVTTIGPGDGVVLTAGRDAAWHYAVTNDGDVDLTDVVLVDDAGTPGDPSDDIEISVGHSGGDTGVVSASGVDPATVVLTGDVGGDGVLSVGESWTITITTESVLGTHTNDADVSAQPIDGNGDPLLGVGGATQPRVTDADPTSYTAIEPPAIDLEKRTNGDDADLATGPFVLADDVVTWTFDVTNTGPTALVDVVVLDPVLQTDPICTIALLLPGASDTCTLVGLRLGSGQQDNVATVSALPAAPTGQFDPEDPETWPSDAGGYVVFESGGEIVERVSAVDSSHHFGADPAITVEKRTNGVDADTADDAVVVVAGSTVTWTFEITNTGNVTLTGIRLDDTDLATDARRTISCPGTRLTAGSSMTCTAIGTAGPEPHADLAEVVGQPVDALDGPIGTEVTASDPSHYRPARSDLAISKTLTAGTTDGVVTSPALTWRLVVTNRGPDPAQDVVVTDRLPAGLQWTGASGPARCSASGSVVSCTVDGVLAVGDSVAIDISTTLVGTPADITNTASVASSSLDDVADNDTAGSSAPVSLPRPQLPSTGSGNGRTTLTAAAMLVVLGVGARLLADRRRATG